MKTDIEKNRYVCNRCGDDISWNWRIREDNDKL